MCGIVSVISKRQAGFFGADLEMFENLLVLDTLRGLDSTGVFCVDSARQVGFLKVASHPFNLFSVQEYAKWRGRAVNSGRILVGHNRKATQGSINSRNAHPFHSGNIIMVHNGTLREDHKKVYAPVDVDSHALTIAFDERGAENVIPEIEGAFALMWWDIEKNRLFAIRNDERPLSIVETDDNYYILSESWMALQLLAKANKKVTAVHDILPGQLYEFQLGGKHTVKDIPVKKEDWSKYISSYSNRGLPRAQHGGANTSSVTPPKSQQGSCSSTGDCGPTQLTSSQKTTTSPSEMKQQTSLTLVKQSDPQQSGEGQQERGLASNHAIVDAAVHVPHPDFHKGQTILVKFYEMKLSDGGMYYLCRGKSAEPATEGLDVLAYIRVAEIPDGDQVKYLHQHVDAVVVKHTTSVCGGSLYVNKVSLPKLLDVHNNRIAETEWNYVTTYCKCSLCQATIYDEERGFTSVTRRPNNHYSVICAECVEESLKGADKHEFNQNRLAAVQTYIGQRPTAAIGDDSLLETSRTPTVH